MKKALSTVLAFILLIAVTAAISFELYASNLPTASIIKITEAQESFRIDMEEIADITGYQLQYSTTPKFTKDTTKAIKTYNTSSTPKNLKGDQKYYVRIRTYKTIGKKTYYSSWSDAESVTTKSKIALKKLTVKPDSSTIEIGKTLQLKTALDPKDTSYKKLKFSSSDTKIATVNSKGLIKGISEGKVKITVRALETDKKVVVNITVKKPYVATTGIKITNKSNLTVETGETLKMTAQVLPEDATNKNVIWSTNDSTKATIDSKGVLTAVRPTEYVEVTAKTKDGNFKASYKLKITKTTGFLKKSDLDNLNLSGVNNLMIVAHPDDETFWGGGHLLNDRYLVVVLTNGFHNERVSDFERVIKKYGNDKGIILSYPDTRRTLYTASGRYNGYETDYWSTCKSGMETDIKFLLNYKKWNTVVTHNPDGEYDKYHHQEVSKLVTKCIGSTKNSDTDLYYFGRYYGAYDKIDGPRISDADLKAKEQIIHMYLPTAQGAYDAFRHMLPYENWIIRNEWQ